MAAVTSPELVAAYWTHYRLSQSQDRDDRVLAQDWVWAFEEVNEAVSEASPGVVELLQSLAEATPDEMACAYLGAGPLEDLIRLHGPMFLRELDEAVRTSLLFRAALQAVWFDATDPTVAKRLRRF